MLLDASFGDVQLARDLLVVQASGEQAQHFEFARGQAHHSSTGAGRRIHFI
jgi:hypothetical protein